MLAKGDMLVRLLPSELFDEEDDCLLLYCILRLLVLTVRHHVCYIRYRYWYYDIGVTDSQYGACTYGMYMRHTDSNTVSNIDSMVACKYAMLAHRRCDIEIFISSLKTVQCDKIHDDVGNLVSVPKLRLTSRRSASREAARSGSASTKPEIFRGSRQESAGDRLRER